SEISPNCPVFRFFASTRSLRARNFQLRGASPRSAQGAHCQKPLRKVSIGGARMPFQSRVFSVLAVLPVVIWVGRYSRWSEAAYREAAAQAAREELAERRRIAAEPHLKEAQRPMPAVRGPYCR